MKPASPLVSVIVAARDAEAFVAQAVDSILRQTVSDLELLVVDDGSRDRTAEIVKAVADPRVAIVTNDEPAGLAASLNRGLEMARGRYVARLDADDVALPRRLERQVALLRSRPDLAMCGSAVLEIDEGGRPGRLHDMPADPVSVRWHALFSSPFYHPTVLLDRDVLERRGLRYDVELPESEDYDLWTRLLSAAEGANLREPHVLYRLHPAQASQARRDLQRDVQRRVALREIERLAPALGVARAELAWRIGCLEPLPSGEAEDAVEAYLALLRHFREAHGDGAGAVLDNAARTLARASLRVPVQARAGVLRRALALRPGLAIDTSLARASRAFRSARARRDAESAQREDGGGVAGVRPVRVAVVAPEPTPYRAPLFDRLALSPELDLTVVYSAESLMWRNWQVALRHRAVFLRGVRVPGAHRVLRHELVLTPGVFRVLARSAPDVCVIVGWSSPASQAAVAWCRTHGIPYVLEVDSNDASPRPVWRRALKAAVVPLVVGGAANALVAGTLARRSLEARGMTDDRIRVFAVTIDVETWGEEAQHLASRRQELRERLGAADGDVLVLSVARLAAEKGLDVLVRAVAAAGNERLRIVVAGSGPERDRLEALARKLAVPLTLLGDVPHDRLPEVYVACDVFALLSRWEPWGVVVNEAAACGLPLLLSEQVGAAADLLRDGENGVLVAAGDVTAAADALRRLAADPAARQAAGARSREHAAEWGYEPSLESFVAAIREAAAAR